jgi:choline dehydrogenase
MGVDPLAVVDPHLKVHGLSVISVADASVMPRIPSGNTHAPCVMIGERAAEFLNRA